MNIHQKSPQKTKKCNYTTGTTKPSLIDGQIVAMNEYGDGEIHGNRKTIKVARTVVGDKVRVVLPQTDKSYMYGKLVNLLQPSQKRVDPLCDAFKNGCGGCQWLHFDYAEQLKWKTKILREMLNKRLNTAIRVNDIIPMETPYGFRNKMSFRNVNGRIVSMMDFNDAVIIADTCRVETIANQNARQKIISLKIHPDIQQAHFRSTPSGQIGVHLFVSSISKPVNEFAAWCMKNIDGCVGVGAQTRKKYTVIAGEGNLSYRYKNLSWTIPLNGFFQTNYTQAETLLETAVTQIACTRNDSVLDLYCGCGFFTLPLALNAKVVTGIENNSSSTSNGLLNAKNNNINNISFLTKDAGIALKELPKNRYHKVLLDPPRSGCDETALRALCAMAPERMVYISCSPQSLVRDLKLLFAHGYTVAYCQPIDMFPHTAHMETVVTLRLRK
ncbi:MAG TPA: 23S rRNA (uracil(1939)-C(5))-methyltransferase RlmD [Chitinispirillaceae bacterium]|nr:23S rRNA (uracil(1939)-C(5))-methyltransferase RlmD [Chitinispirillaceae bacterium]